MADTNLSIVIQAQVQQAQTAIAQVNKTLQQTATSAAPVSAAITKVNTAVTNLKPGANQAGNALMNLGRIAQDAPFGFIGISNNINPLLESFQRLKAETGTTGGAFKALGSSLLGGGGLGLAVSVVTGLLVVFGDKIFKSSSSAKKAQEETDAYGQSLAGISSSLGEEATRIGVLVKAIESETLTKKQRAGAIKELQSLNPDYFNGLKEEAGLVGKLKVAYQAYVLSLKTQFGAKALDKQISELFDKKTRIEAEITPTVSSTTNRDLSNIIARYQAEFDKLGGQKAFNAIPINNTELTAAQQRLRDLFGLIKQISNTPTYDPQGAKTTKELDDINKRIDGLLARRAQLENFDIKIEKDKKPKKEEDVLANRIQQLEALKNATGLLKTEELDLLNVRLQMADRDQAKNGLSDFQLNRFRQSLVENADLTVEVTTKLAKIDPGPINTELALVNTRLNPLITNIKVNTTEAQKKLEDFNKTMQSATEAAASSLAQGIGDVLGEALSGGNPLAAGLALIADTLIQLGKAAVGAGIAMLSLKSLFKNPATAIAAGIAAIAVGAAVKSSIPKFAEGGIATKATAGIFGEAGTEAIIPLKKLPGLVAQMTGGQSGSLTATGVLRGTDIALAVARTNKQYGTTLR